MKFNHTHEKTTFIPVGNQLVQVSSFPQEVKNEVETLDRLHQERLDAIYEVEKIELAIYVKLQQVNAFAAKMIEEANAQAADSSSKTDEKPKKTTKK